MKFLLNRYKGDMDCQEFMQMIELTSLEADSRGWDKEEIENVLDQQL